MNVIAPAIPKHSEDRESSSLIGASEILSHVEPEIVLGLRLRLDLTLASLDVVEIRR